MAHGIMCCRDTALLLAAASLDMSHIIERILIQTKDLSQDPWLCRKTLSRTVTCKLAQDARAHTTSRTMAKVKQNDRMHYAEGRVHA